jgi:hypothetical protein
LCPKSPIIKKPAAKARPKAVTKTKKAPPAKKGKLSIKEILFKEFDTAKAPPAKKKKAVKIPDAPPLVTGYGKKETERIKALLFKRFDSETKPKAQKKPAAKTKDAVKKAPPAPPPPKLPEETPPPSVLDSDGTGKGAKIGLCVLGILILIIFATSLSNRDKFYLKNADGALEVWRGRFAPTGKELVMTLQGVKAPNPTREVYAKKDVDPILFDYLQRQALKALNDSRGPDLAKLKNYLRQAEAYAPTGKERQEVQQRLQGIDFIVLLHKADFAISRGTPADLKAAKSYLNKADRYATRSYHREMLAKTRKAVDIEMASLRKR